MGKKTRPAHLGAQANEWPGVGVVEWNMPATDRQRKLLRAQGRVVALHDDLTRGRAARAINVTFAERRAREAN